jgi:hypothetical protein
MDPTTMAPPPAAPAALGMGKLLELIMAAQQPPATSSPANILDLVISPTEKPPQDEDEYADVEDETVLRMIEELEQDGGKLRYDEEASWQIAWRYYNGKHWGDWDESGNLVDLEDEDIPHLVLNYILHLVQTRLAHLIKSRPILQGLPGRPDENARNATRLAVRVLEAYWRKLHLPRKLAEALLWMLVTGKSFWKVYWDPTLGPAKSRPGPDGKPLPAVPEGDLRVDVVFGHEILVNPGAMDLDPTSARGAQRLLHTSFKPIGEALRRWEFNEEDEAALKKLAEETSSIDQARRELEGLTHAPGSSLEGLVPVKELWCRPSQDFPNGLRAVSINGKIAVRKDGQRELTPTPRGYPDIPFVEFDEIKTNSFWSTSTARQLLDINQVINIELSQQEHRRKVLRYKTLIPEQANIDKDAFDRTDTEIISYWAPFKPEHLAPPETRPGEVEIRNALIGIVKELGGSFDVLSGRTSGEVRSGRQTAYLQEYAGTVLALVAMLIEWSLTAFGNMALGLLREKVTEDRFESFVGRDRRIQVVSFIGADLDGCNEIIVQPMSSLLMSRTERMDRIENWMDKGWLKPDIGLRLLDLGDFDTEIYSEEEQDRQNADEMIFRLQNAPTQFAPEVIAEAQALAEREGNRMSERYVLRALRIEAFIFDNHAIHQQQIDRNLRKTAEYREWPPQKRALVDALFEWHQLLKLGGPIETPINPMPMPTGTEVVPGAPPPLPEAAGEGGGDAGGDLIPPSTGSPQALQGGIPPGGGGVGGEALPGAPESAAERAAGLPGVPRPPGPGPGPGSLPPNP